MFTIVAKIKSSAGREKEIQEMLTSLIAPTRAEEGCIEYRLHRSIEDISVFLFYENWESKVLWEKHMQSPHLKSFQQNASECMEAFELYQLEPQIF